MKHTVITTRLWIVQVILFSLLAAIMSVSSAQADTAIYTLNNVVMHNDYNGQDGQMTGTFSWTYDVNDFENGVGAFSELSIQWLAPSDYDLLVITFDIGNSIEFTRAGASGHDAGIDVTLFFQQSLTPTGSTLIDLTRSKFDIGGNGFIFGAFTDGSIANVTNVSGSIGGTITDAASGGPVSGVEIQIYDASGNYVNFSNTDVAGNYVLSTGLPDGTYFAVTSNYDGYINEAYDDLPCTVVCDPASGTPIVVTTGNATTGIDFALNMHGLDPVADIKANGSDGPLLIAFGTALQLDISLIPNGALGQVADWWLVTETPDGWYWYDLSGSWVKSVSPIPTYGGALFDITSMAVLNSSNLPIGSYRIYFGVDTNANGILDFDVLFTDTVDVTIQ